MTAPLPAVCLPAFLLLALFSAGLVRAMIARGSLDVPGTRSSHETPTPRGGGVGPIATLVIGLLYSAATLPWHEAMQTLCVMTACLLLAWVSHRDDVRQGHFRAKLGAQLGAALIVVGCGIGLPHPADAWATALAALLSVGWLLFATNAMNFIDGLNGLAAGSMLVGSLALAWIGWPGWVGIAAGSLAAGLAGFLPFNYPNARIFMGDVGSQPCGFAVAAFGLAAGDAGWTLAAWHLALLVPFLFFAIYADVFFTLLRRWHAGERLTQAHRGHLYQLAQRSFAPAWAVSALHFVFVGIGLTAWLLWSRSHAAAIVLLLAPQVIWGAIVLRRAGSLLAR